MGNCLGSKKKRKHIPTIQPQEEFYKERESKFNPINENDSPLEKDYEIENDIGVGAFGKVVKAFHRPSQEYRAIKVINTKNLPLEEKRKILQEINILSKLDHPNIIKIYEYFITSRSIYIVMELVDGGELFDEIVKAKHFSEVKAAKIMKDILSAVQFCHNKRIAHRDLKPENILVDGDSLKIIDFGTSRKFEVDKLMTNSHGTPYYIAPEVLYGEYNEKCDIWSCGVILYILLSGDPPFKGNNDGEIMEKVKTGYYSFGKKFKNVSSDAKNLIKIMLEKDIYKRPSASECLKNKWFENNIQKSQKEVNLNVIENLKTFTYKNKLQEAVYKFFVNQIATKEEKKVALNLSY